METVEPESHSRLSLDVSTVLETTQTGHRNQHKNCSSNAVRIVYVPPETTSYKVFQHKYWLLKAAVRKSVSDIDPWWLRRCVSRSSSSVLSCWLSLHLVSNTHTQTRTHTRAALPLGRKTSGSLSNSSPQVLCYKLPSIQLLHQLVLTAARRIIGSAVKK